MPRHAVSPDEQAWTAEMDYRWQVLRVKKGVQGQWTGDYKTAQDALAALQKEFD